MIRRTFASVRISLVCLALAAVLRGTLPLGLSQGITADPTASLIHVSANLVVVPVSVTDPDGRPVNDLKMQDFRIEEDGRPERIAKIVEPGESPLQLALLFDLSGSLRSRFELELKAATRFLERVWEPGDTISIVAFNADPLVVLQASSDMPAVLQALFNLEPTEGSTAFFDSVVTAAHLLRQSATPEARRAGIVLSDGEDNNSRDYRLPDALREVQHSDCIFYSINPGGSSIRLNDISLRGQEALRCLASETGGTAFVADNPGDLDEIFGRIATELRAQYSLIYYSSNPRMDNCFRQIVVSIPKRPGLRVYARRGYYAVVRR